MANIYKLFQIIFKSQITYGIVFFSCLSVGIIFANWLILLPLYLFSLLFILGIPLYSIFYLRKKEGNSPIVFLRKIYILFLLILSCAYGIGKINNWLFEITGKEVSKAIDEHWFTIDPRDLREVEKFVTNTHFLFSTQLNQLYYSDDSGLGHALSRSYCLFGVFPWFGDYLWDGDKWVEYRYFYNKKNKEK